MNSLEAAEIVAPNGKTDDCAKFTIENPNTTFTFKDICTVGQDYVFGCYAKSDGVNSISIGDTTYPASQAWSRIVDKFNATSVNFVITFSAPGTYYLYNSKLEIGNVDTDWSPAPEDIFQKTAEIEITVDGITSTVTDLEGNVAKVEETAQSIISTVTDLEGNLTSLESSVDGLTSTVRDVEGNMSQLQQTVGGLQSTVTDIEGNYSQLTQKVDGLGSTVTDLNGNYSSLAQTVNGFEAKLNTSKFTSPWVECSTDADTAAKTVSVSSGFKLVGGATITVRFTNGHTASTMTMNVNGTGAKAVYASGNNPPNLNRYSTVTMVYSGASWTMADSGSLYNAKDAAKTATNYLSFSSSGLVVGNHTGTLQGNALLNSSGMQVRNGTTIYATYGASQTELGRNSASSRIKMCGGVVSIYADSSYGQLASSRGLGLIANSGQAQLTGSSGVLIGSTSAITYIYGSSVQARAGGSMRTLKPVYRLYNPYDKCYLETAESSEANGLVQQGWQQQRADVFYAFK